MTNAKYEGFQWRSGGNGIVVDSFGKAKFGSSNYKKKIYIVFSIYCSVREGNKKNIFHIFN